jgi:hypothetical protein
MEVAETRRWARFVGVREGATPVYCKCSLVKPMSSNTPAHVVISLHSQRAKAPRTNSFVHKQTCPCIGADWFVILSAVAPSQFS